MAKFNKTNYQAKYPDLEISKEVLKYLNQSDRRIFYQEREIKESRNKVDMVVEKVTFRSALEDSYDRLVEEEGMEFRIETVSVEDTALNRVMADKLRNCLSFLTEEEMRLVDGLYFRGLSERQLSSLTGVAQRTIHDRKVRLLFKLKKLMENQK